MSETPPASSDAKAMVATGKVKLAGLAGDKSILMALKTNEEDTNTAYERAVRREDVSPQLRVILRRNLADERWHREWVESAIDGL